MSRAWSPMIDVKFAIGDPSARVAHELVREKMATLVMMGFGDLSGISLLVDLTVFLTVLRAALI